MRKYEFTGETMVYFGSTLHRIRAVRDFGVKENYFRNVKAGDLGGWIEKEDNLSHEGLCWVSEGAIVCDSAIVFDNARVFGNAVVSDNARICEIALVSGDAIVSDNAVVEGYAKIGGNTRIRGNARVGAYVEVSDNALVEGYARIGGNTYIGGDSFISGDAIVKSMRDYIVFKNWWSSGLYFTWTRSNDKWIDFSLECEVDEWHYNHFHGSGEELVKRAYQESELSGREYERIVKYVESIKKEAL